VSKDAGADLETLCVNTLENALDGLMREASEVREYLDALPVEQEVSA
jgi:hypothetical protein